MIFGSKKIHQKKRKHPFYRLFLHTSFRISLYHFLPFLNYPFGVKNAFAFGRVKKWERKTCGEIPREKRRIANTWVFLGEIKAFAFLEEAKKGCFRYFGTKKQSGGKKSKISFPQV